MLEQLIREELARDGRMTFARYLDLVLYHPRYGYYSSKAPPIGPDGDFYTSTDVSPLFGAAIGRQLYEMWCLLGQPHPFSVLEYGAGKGLLAADVLGWTGAAHPDMFRSISYVIVEISSSLRCQQAEKLSGLPVSWMAQDAIEPGSLTGCALSNEVADALPFHRVQQLDGELRELWVVADRGGLREEPQELSTPALQEYLLRNGIDLREGQKAEVRLTVAPWAMAQVTTLNRGFVLTIDYGDLSDRLYNPDRLEGTLRCYYRHTSNQEPFVRISKQDITAHVNFSDLANAYRTAGAEITGFTTQAFFLASLGLGEALAGVQERALTRDEWERDRNAVLQLILPDGLGGFKVLLAHKGVENPRLRGLSVGSGQI